MQIKLSKSQWELMGKKADMENDNKKKLKENIKKWWSSLSINEMKEQNKISSPQNGK